MDLYLWTTINMPWCNMFAQTLAKRMRPSSLSFTSEPSLQTPAAAALYGSLHSADDARDCRHRSWIPGSTTLPLYTLLGKGLVPVHEILRVDTRVAPELLVARRLPRVACA